MFEERNPIFEEENQKKLIEQIQTAPDCRIFGVSRFNQTTTRRSIFLTIIVALVLITIVLVFYHPIFTIIFLIVIITFTLIVCGILSYMNYSHKYFKTFVSELGIAKQSVWDEGAIPWEIIEYIEIKNKGDGIDYILFRSGSMKLGYRNSHFVTRLSLEIISEYVGGIERWHIFDDLKETSETIDFDILYMNPDIDKSEGLKKLEDVHLMEWIGEQDYDADKTKEHTSAKSNDELYELIVNDPQCECIIDYGRFNRIISNYKTIGVMIFVAIGLTFLGMAGGPFSIFIFITAFALFMLMLYSLLKGYEKLIMSPIGIARYFCGSPEAIEWQHVEYIDLISKEDNLVISEFFGNKRRVFCPSHIYKQLITIDIIRKYISDIDNWEKMKRDQWPEDTFRLVRPDA